MKNNLNILINSEEYWNECPEDWLAQPDEVAEIIADLTDRMEYHD